MDRKILEEMFGGKIPPGVEAHYINEKRAERYRSIVKPTRFAEQCAKYGVKDEAKIRFLQACCESNLESIEREAARAPHVFRENGQRLLAQRNRLGYNPETYALEATSVSDIAAFRDFSFGVVREIWPMLAPLAMMVSVQSMPGPSERLFYAKTYGDDAGTFYSANWRLQSNVDTDYDEYTCGTEPNEVSFVISGVNVDALAYALLGRWDLCAEQDAQSQFGFTLSDEIVMLIAKTIARAKVSRIRDNLIGSASGGTVAWSTTATAGSEYTLDSAGVKAWQRTMFDAIIDVDRLIFDKRYNHINWAWVSSDVGARMRKMNDHRFVPASDGYSGDIQTVTTFYGTIDGSIGVWCDPDAAANTCLLGVSPRGLDTTGYLIGEYVPFMPTDRFMDPADLSPRRAGITRYAEKLVDGAFYGKLSIS